MIIGIIAAEEKEMLAVRNIMENREEEKVHNLIFNKGSISNKDCVLVECGVGKVNAARVAQIMIDIYKVNYVINVGVAGGTSNELKIKDIVIGEKLVQHDFDITSVGDYEKGEIARTGKFFESDKRLVKICEEIVSEVKDDEVSVKIGVIASGDYFCASPEKATQIRKEFNADCVEMEGAAIAQICFLDKVPFLVIRGISDTPNGNNEMDFHTYIEFVSKQVSEILKRLIEKI